MKALILLLAVFIAVGSPMAKACSEDDLTEITLKEYKPCYLGWCKK